MSYLDDLRTMTYTSPSGASFELVFDDVNRTGGKKSVIIEPPQQSRAVVQDLGNKGVRFSVTVYIVGMDYHTTADEFFTALSEPCDSDNPATWSHPRWGDILVCPEGDFSQAESFVDGMGQAVFSFDLVRVDRSAKFPTLKTDSGSKVKALTAAAKAATIAGAKSAFDPSTAARAISNVRFVITNAVDSLRGVASQVADIGTEFDALVTTLTSVDVALVSAGSDLASSLISLITIISPADVPVSEKVLALSEFANSLTGIDVDSEVALSTLSVTSSAVAIATADSILVGHIATRQDAIDSSNQIDSMLLFLQSIIETAESGVGAVADRDTVDALTTALSEARSRLLEQSFSLRAARVTVLPVSVDPNTAVKLLYGTWSDDLLDRFVADNDLQGEEFFLLPPGFEAVWYA